MGAAILDSGCLKSKSEIPAVRRAEKVKLLWCNLLNSTVLSWPKGVVNSNFSVYDNYNDNSGMVTQISHFASR